MKRDKEVITRYGIYNIITQILILIHNNGMIRTICH